MTPPRAIRLPLLLTHLGLGAERVTRAFWPLWSVLFALLAAWGFGLIQALPEGWLQGVIALSALALAAALWHARGFRWPSRDEAMARLDATLPGRPISTLADTPATGDGALWAAHLKRMEQRLSDARAVPGDLRVSRADPYALRYIATFLLALALLFGGAWRGTDLAGGLGTGPASALQTGPAWEAWLIPPRYTGKPTLYLGDIDQSEIKVPAGTQLTLRLYGEVGALRTGGTLLPTEDALAPTQDATLTTDGTLTIEGAGEALAWTLIVQRDSAPTIFPETPPAKEPPSQMRLPFQVVDDYGIAEATATIALDLSAMDRRYGLAVDPEPRPDLILQLPLPISGARDAFSEVLVEDVSKHPFANLPVTITLTALDAADQTGTSEPMQTTLPGRSFFDPLAGALIEMRRDLLWARANAPRTAQVLRALTHRNDDGFTSPSAFILTRMAIARLEANPDLDTTTRDDVAELLWRAAIELEEGNLDTALARLREAQERLAEAIRQGASSEEIERLMDEMREAMNNYLQQRAQQQAQEGQQQQQQGQPQRGEGQEITNDQLDQMLERIEELMREGRTAEAQQLLEEMQQMLENMQVQQGEGGEGQQQQQGAGQQAMDDLRDSLRQQQGLSDEAFRELQEQFNPNAQAGESQENAGRNGGQGAGAEHDGTGGEGQQGSEGGGEQPGQAQGGGTGDLAGRQQALRDQVEGLQQSLPGQGTPEGEAARDALGEASRAMDDAANNLAEGNIPQAIDDQARAMDALREGMQNLGEAMAQEQENGQGQQGTEFGENGQARQQDPLGRNPGQSGQLGTDESLLNGDDPRARSRELLDEIRRRSAEMDRPQVEREYLDRLLDQF